MSNMFVFKKIRSSTVNPGEIILQGYVNNTFEKESNIEVVYKSGDDVKQLSFCVKITKDVGVYSSSDTNYCICISIKTPDVISARDKMRIISSFTDGTKQVLCDITGKKLIKKLAEIDSNIDEVTIENDTTIVKGWAIDYNDLGITVADKSGNEIEHSISRYTRSDVGMEHPEYDKRPNVGFLLKVPTNKRFVVRIGNADRFVLYRIHGSGKLISNVAVFRKLYNYVHRFIYSVKSNGLKVTLRKLKRKLKQRIRIDNVNYQRWIKKHVATSKQLKIQKQEYDNGIFANGPKFSILVPLYESDEDMLGALIDSVKNQTYGNWELCFSDGSKSAERLKRFIDRYSAADTRIKFISEKEGPLGIADNTNQAYELVTGDYIVLGDHDDLFMPDALYECAKAISNDLNIDVIYTDEDKVDKTGKKFFQPNFKPDYNIDLLRSNNYICHMFVAKKNLVDKVGLFDKAFDGAQDYDFIFRCVEQAKSIYHIPKVLYRWRVHEKSTAATPEAKLYAFEAGKRAIKAHLDRVGVVGTVEEGAAPGFYKTSYRIVGNPKISIIIPNKDHIDDLKKCMDAIDNRSTYRNYEYVIVENNSTEEETFEFYKSIESRSDVKVLYWKEDFNFSAINNFGVAESSGEYVLLLNNDTEIINDDCLEQLLGYCQREEVGAVGARLYYEDGTIQHAGVIIGFGGIAGHTFVGMDENDDLYMSRTKVACDYNAVTAACVMVKKSVFNEVGGLEEEFRVAFNDIDFCMKIRTTGRLVVYNPFAMLYHYESKSRGLEDTPEKIERFNSEVKLFQTKWADVLKKGDEYYNPNLSLDRADFGLRV